MSPVRCPRPAFGPDLILKVDAPQGPPMNPPSIGLVSGFRLAKPHGRGWNETFAGYQSPGFQYHSRKLCENFHMSPSSYRNLSIQKGRRISSHPYAGGGTS